MSKQIKKKIIGLAAGLAIIGGSVATAIILANLANSNIKSFMVSYDKLLEIRNRILSEYSKNADINNQCTVDEFVQKVNDGTLKSWIDDNFKDYFKAIDSSNEFNFNLKINQNDNEILLTLTPEVNQSLRLEQHTNSYDSSIVDFNENFITFKFLKSEFLKQQLFSHEQFNLFKQKMIADMQLNKLTFESLENNSTQEQKNQIMDWASKLLGINNIFESIKFEKLQAEDSYSITLTPNKDYVFGWIGSEQNDTDFNVARKELTINFNKIITIENDVLVQLKEKVDTFLQNKNINYLSWLEHIEAKDSEYNEFINYIYEQLNNLMNNTKTGYIETIEILNDGNGIYSLKIIPSSGYSFLSKSDYYENGNIVLIDIEFDSYIAFNSVDIDSFITKLQSSIDIQKYNKTQFNSWISTTYFKNYVSRYLQTSIGTNLEVSKIENISYDQNNNELVISPINAYRFKILSNNANAAVNQNGELVISNLKLFEYINFKQLDTLFNNVQQFIDKAKFANEEFNAYLTNSNNVETLKSLICESLYISTTQKLDVNKIETIDFTNDNLVISLDSDYTIYSAEQNNDVTLATNVLTIKNLKFFKVVDLLKLTNLFNTLQTLIDTQKYTFEEFNQYAIGDLDAFKNLIASNLFINQTDTLLVSEIIDITVEKDAIRISLNNNYTKYNAVASDNIKLENTDLVIRNINYYTAYDFDNLDSLFNIIQNEIKNNKYTVKEFETYLATDSFKNLIANNLYISENQTLAVDKIDSINLNKNTNELNVVLSDNYLKYTFTNNNHVSLNDTTLTIDSLNYYTAYEFVDINLLFNKIQELINTNKFTQDEFKKLVNITNNEQIKTLIADNLWISTSDKLSIDNILDVKLNDNYQLEITFNDDYKKYIMTENDKATLTDNVLTIDNFAYFSSIRISNLSAVFDYINNIVTTNDFAPSELITYINNNLEQIKTELSSLMHTSSTDTLDKNEITNISVNSLKFEITLNSVNEKYTIEEYENATLNNNTISFSNLDFSTIIKFTNISNVYSNIQKIINDACYTKLDFVDYVAYNKSSLKTLISDSLSKIIDGPGSWSINQISDIKYSSNNFKIYFKPPTKYKYEFESASNVTIADNVITMSNFTYYEPSPTSWFTWLGNSITGVTTEGKKQSVIKIPERCTEIGSSAFRHSNLKKIVIPWSVKKINEAAFYSSYNLNSVVLAEGIEYIGKWAFYSNNSLREIKIPNSVTNIDDHAFRASKNITKLNIDVNNSQLQRIGEYAFEDTGQIAEVNIPVNCTIIGDLAFANNNYTTTIKIYSNVLTLENEAFSNLLNLRSIYVYNITNPSELDIYNNAFKSSRSADVYVRNEAMKNKFQTQTFDSFSVNGIYII